MSNDAATDRVLATIKAALAEYWMYGLGIEINPTCDACKREVERVRGVGGQDSFGTHETRS